MNMNTTRDIDGGDIGEEVHRMKEKPSRCGREGGREAREGGS